MEEGMQPMRRGCLVLVLALVVGAIAFLAWFRHGMIATVAGREYPPQEEEAWLKQGLESHFRWAGLPENSLEKVWVNGFREHTYLYRIRLSPGEFAGLRQAVLTSEGEGVRIDDRDDLGLCPLGFGTSTPQGPEKMKVPEWWEVASLHSFDGLLWRSGPDGYWFGYDREREILFLLVYN